MQPHIDLSKIIHILGFEPVTFDDCKNKFNIDESELPPNLRSYIFILPHFWTLW